MEPDDIICDLRVSRPRHVIGFAFLAGLGGLLLYIAFNSPPQNPLWLVFLLVLSGAVLFLALRFWTAARAVVVLTNDGLFLEDGTLICAMSNIRSVERGAFAFKPSNGFMVRLKERTKAGWMPGLWWRVGRMVGVGGVTPAAQGKMMADMIAAIRSQSD